MSWKSQFRSWLELDAVKNTDFYVYGKFVADGDDVDDEDCRKEGDRRSNEGEGGPSLWILLCKLRKAIANAPKRQNSVLDVPAEVVKGTPIWELIPPLSPYPATFPKGYLYLITHYQLSVIGHHTFYVISINKCEPEAQTCGGIDWRLIHDEDYLQYTVWDHLQFAVEVEDINLCILYALFTSAKFDECGFEDYIKASLKAEQEVSIEDEKTKELLTLLGAPMEVSSQPSLRGPNATARRLWYWYEFLTDKQLAVSDHPLDTNAPFLLDVDFYYTSTPITASRFGLQENHLGCREYCPIVRKTLLSVPTSTLAQQYSDFLRRVPISSLTCVFNYLITGDTQASFEIEREKASVNRVQQVNEVVANMMSKSDLTVLSKEELCNMNAIFLGIPSSHYRDFQNWIGISYIPPKPADVESLMSGLLITANKLISDPQVDAIVAAVIVAVGFVDIHPFGDGNGRLHRNLIHYVLGKKIYFDKMIIPLSKQLLVQRSEYFDQLSAHHHELINVIAYTMDYANSTLIVNTPITHHFYRYPEMTTLATFIRAVITTAICKLPDEVCFIQKYNEVLEDLRAAVGGDPAIAKCALDKYLETRGNYGFIEAKAFPSIPVAILLEKGKSLLIVQPKL